jgi:acetyltransferase
MFSTPDAPPITPISRDVSPILTPQRSSLDSLFKPKNVAVIGASENPGSVGRTILWNLISSPFGGTVFPVNPKRSSVLGIKAYPSIAEVPEPIDLAVIITPAPTVPDIIAQCVAAGVSGAIIISAGFKEAGESGIALEHQVLEEARRGNMRIIGPNCLGVMSPLSGLNATFASAMARPGKVGFLSQSGALCTAILDWSLQEDVGFSAFVSLGSMLDVGWGDLINYLGDDPQTESILIYMESVGDARSFLSAAREVSLAKPIIVIKAGRTEAAAKAAASHTGSLAGSDEVLDAAFRRSGVLRVNHIEDLFSMAEVLAKQPRPRGPRLMIVTNAGGPGVLATDALITDGGLLAEPAPATVEALNEFLPAHWSHNNPIDILGDAPPERYAQTVAVAAEDPNSDALLVVLTPQSMSDPTLTAEKLKPYANKTGKPILASWMGGTDVEAGRAILSRANIPNFRYPDMAAHAFRYMWQYSENLRGLYETPSADHKSETSAPDSAAAAQIIQTARDEGRTLLTEYESKQLLTAYRIPTVETRIATSIEEAVKQAKSIGFPVVLKLHSRTITHKTDVGGVQLNLVDAEAVRTAYEIIRSGVPAADFDGVTVQPMEKQDGYEIIIGSSLDAQFGPVLLFGSGGQLVEVYKDRALGLPPLNSTLARRLMEQTRIFTALQGVRGRAPIDLGALEQLLVRFSQLVTDQRWIKEIDINPLLASPERLIALDARVVIHDAAMTEANLPPLAIRPYPSQYVSTLTLPDNTLLTLSPIRPEDEPLLVRFHETLSQRSVYLRYAEDLELSQRIAHERLIRHCYNDYDREIALVAKRHNAHNEQEVVGVGRLTRLHGTDEAEFAIVISDAMQGHGLGTELLSRLVEIGREEKLSRISAKILPDNFAMQKICESLGFTLSPVSEEIVHAQIEL